MHRPARAARAPRRARGRAGTCAAPGHDDVAVEACDAAAARIVGTSAERWVRRTGAERYLPDLIARVFLETSGAHAAFVPPAHHGAQAPLDGIMAELPAGPITALDVIRLFPADDYGPVVAELAPGELRTVVERHAAFADPRSRAGDDPWWNWCRMPAASHPQREYDLGRDGHGQRRARR